MLAYNTVEVQLSIEEKAKSKYSQVRSLKAQLKEKRRMLKSTYENDKDWHDLDWKPQDVKDLKRLVDERLGKPRNEGFIRGIKTVQWDLVYKLFWGKESEMK